MGSVWKISTRMEPKYDAFLINNKFIGGGIFIHQTRVQRNTKIKKDYRILDGESSTICFVVDEKLFYILINNPSSDTTQDSDWEVIDVAPNIFIPLGVWDPTTNTPILTDDDAIGKSGEFYFADNIPSGYDYNNANMFGGEETNLQNSDWVISNGTRWYRIRNSQLSWNNLSNKPQSIINYTNGIIISHSHSIDDIVDLTTTLAGKVETSNVLNTSNLLSDPDSKVVSLGFLKLFFYDKSQTYTKSEISNLFSNNTYNKQEIDDKDEAVLAAANAYTDAHAGGGGSGSGLTKQRGQVFTADGITTRFTVNTLSAVPEILVDLGGQIMVLGIHYTITGKNIDFSVAPENGITVGAHIKDLPGSLSGQAPSNVIISANSINENNALNQVIGNISADGDTPITFELLDIDDIDSFNINGEELRASEVFDFESKSSYSITIRATNGVDFIDQDFTITINDLMEVVPVSGLQITSTAVDEGNTVNQVLAILSVAAGDTPVTYSLSTDGGEGSDNDAFNINNNEFRASEIFDFVSKSSYEVQIKADNVAESPIYIQITFTINEVSEDSNITNADFADDGNGVFVLSYDWGGEDDEPNIAPRVTGIVDIVGDFLIDEVIQITVPIENNSIYDPVHELVVNRASNLIGTSKVEVETITEFTQNEDLFTFEYTIVSDDIGKKLNFAIHPIVDGGLNPTGNVIESEYFNIDSPSSPLDAYDFISYRPEQVASDWNSNDEADWNNLGNQGFSILKSASSLPPTFDVGEQGFLFDGTHDLIFSKSPGFTYPFEIVIGIKPTNLTGVKNILGLSNSAYLFSNDTTLLYIDQNIGTLTINEWNFIRIKFNGASSQAQINDDAITNENLASFSIGATDGKLGRHFSSNTNKFVGYLKCFHMKNNGLIDNTEYIDNIYPELIV